MELKELTNRKYDGNDCIGFTYSVKEETSDTEIEFKFTRKSKESRLWQMEVNLPRTINADMQCYIFPYEMPRDNMQLTLICATGITYFHVYLKDEISFKSMIDFELGEITRNM